ncbi:MAG: thiamine phosphate synthase [Paracoccaceae bacterium]|nr:thiamine phosphate synthase [Paracoccaceae bacterium]
MADAPQIYLLTPPDFELSTFRPRLEAVLDAGPVACLRLAMASRDEDRLSRASDMVREVGHARDIAVVIDQHWTLADRLGLDGVHLLDGARSVRTARKALGPDRVVGAYAGRSRHDGMNAGEAGADYVAFGPVGDGVLAAEGVAEPGLFQWWSELIEVPVVAEGGVTPEGLAAYGPFVDFVALGEEIWRADDPVAALTALRAAMG